MRQSSCINLAYPAMCLLNNHIALAATVSASASSSAWLHLWQRVGVKILKLPADGMLLGAGTQHVDAEFADICDAVSATKQIKHKTRLLFTKKHAPQLTAAILIPAFQQLNGINSITFYAPQLFSSIGAGFSGTYGALESSVVIDAIEMAGTLIGVATVDRYALPSCWCCGLHVPKLTNCIGLLYTACIHATSLQACTNCASAEM